MKKFITSDITIGIVLTLITLFGFIFQIGFFESLELKTYDWRAYLNQSNESSPEIAIIAIDDDSINKIGRWPWPRSVIAEGIRATNEAQAKVIGLNILFTEPEKNQELNEIRKLNNSLSTILKGVKKSRNTNTRKIENTFSKKIRTLLSSELTEIEKRMDNDSHLSNILAESNNVILPMFFNIGPALGEEEPVLWEQTLADIENPDDLEFYYITEGYGPVIPLGIFSDNLDS